jgi:hypothetical protein
LEDYEQKMNIKLTEHSLAEIIEKCHSVEDITGLLQEQVQAFRGSDNIMKSIERSVKVLHKVSDMAGAIGLVRVSRL